MFTSMDSFPVAQFKIHSHILRLPYFQVVHLLYLTAPFCTVLLLFHSVASFTVCLPFCAVVCIVCSHLEKLRARLLNIRQKHRTSQQHPGAQEEQKDVFSVMQKELNEEISHHQMT